MDDLIVDGLAAARITRLVTQDTFPPAKALRERWVREFGQGSSLAELIECAWCAGFWIAAGCRIARRVAPRWWGPVAEVFAVAMVGSYFVGKSTEEGDPQDVAQAIKAAAPLDAGAAEDQEGGAEWQAVRRIYQDGDDTEAGSRSRHPTGLPMGARRRARTKGQT